MATVGFSPLLFAPAALAQKTTRKPAADGKTVVTKGVRPPRPAPANQLQFRLGASIWQENIKVRSGANQGNMETQSQGLVTSLAYLIPSNSRVWMQHYSADFGFGAVKGKGRTAAIPDELKGQLWLTGGFSPGLLYRTSPISAVGLLMPFSYRMIRYKLKDGSSFNPEGDSSFSVGGSAVYINQLSKANYLYLSVTYQALWAATAWNLSWQYKFL